MARFSLRQQIEELQRERDQRASVYPRLIASRKLGASLAQYHCDRLEAAIRTLDWLQQHEAVIRERCPELFTREGR